MNGGAPDAEAVGGPSDKSFPDRIREELSKHLRVVGMTLKNVWKIMDLNGNGLVSMSEFQSGLKDISWDPVVWKVGSPRACFMALTRGKPEMTPGMFLGPAAPQEPDSPAPTHHRESEGDGEERESEQNRPVRTPKQKIASAELDLKPEDQESEEENDEGEGD